MLLLNRFLNLNKPIYSSRLDAKTKWKICCKVKQDIIKDKHRQSMDHLLALLCSLRTTDMQSFTKWPKNSGAVKSLR